MRCETSAIEGAAYGAVRIPPEKSTQEHRLLLAAVFQREIGAHLYILRWSIRTWKWRLQ